MREALSAHAVTCDLTVLRDGEQALAFFDRVDREGGVCPGLVILDLNLPKRSGHDVLGRIRASAACSNVPVLILTSSNAQRDRQEAAARGATAYLRKPLLLDDFIELGGVFKQMLVAGG